jgi:hypothetical protein
MLVLSPVVPFALAITLVSWGAFAFDLAIWALLGGAFIGLSYLFGVVLPMRKHTYSNVVLFFGYGLTILALYTMAVLRALAAPLGLAKSPDSLHGFFGELGGAFLILFSPAALMVLRVVRLRYWQPWTPPGARERGDETRASPLVISVVSALSPTMREHFRAKAASGSGADRGGDQGDAGSLVTAVHLSLADRFVLTCLILAATLMPLSYAWECLRALRTGRRSALRPREARHGARAKSPARQAPARSWRASSLGPARPAGCVGRPRRAWPPRGRAEGARS